MSKPHDAPGQALLFDADRYCTVCGRRLTSELSCRRGLGPACWRKSRERRAESPEAETVSHETEASC